jgi:tetratricopeptide (TPR) repeat protein
MRTALLTMLLLLVLCFGLVAWLDPRHQARIEANEPGGQGTLGGLLGETRQTVADYFYTQADVYFHSGYYPSIFDAARKQEEQDSDVSHPGEGSSGHEEKGFMGPPLDWIDRFGRHFIPSRHTHLHGEAVAEMLPWLKLSADLDPHRIQTYLVTDYWLRSINKSADAEEFIRQGLRANPHSPDLLYALGQIYLEDRKDYFRAKNLFLAGKKEWHKRDDPKPAVAKNGEEAKDYLLLERILAGLVKDEEATGHLDQAVRYLQELKPDAGDPTAVQKLIDGLQAKIKAQPGANR